MAEEGFFGQRGLTSGTSDLNAIDFLIEQKMGEMWSNIPVRVVAVNGGGVGAPPTVDVQPMVNQIDGQGNQTPHGIIYGLPATRSQGGGNAIINDPKVGDVGFVSVSSRDISALKSNQGAQSNPGSYRMFNLSDGVYVGAMLNPANPNQYVQFTDTGIKLLGVGGAVVEMNGADVFITGTLHVTGDVIAGDGAVSLLTHTHNGVTPGGGNTGPPNT